MKNNIKLKEQNLAQKIIFVRGEKVLLDFDLSVLYLVETRTLKQVVKRNRKRFPKDFLFILSSKEINHLQRKLINWKKNTMEILQLSSGPLKN